METIPMRLDDGTILMHGKKPYDPVKAHEYYIRTRQLKGRKTGSPTFSVRRPGGSTVTLTTRQLTEQRAYAAKRINDIKLRLSELNSKLSVALREAREKKVKTEREAKKPPTAAEKSKAARESEQYREKHQQKLATKRKTAAARTNKSEEADPVKELQTKIGEIKKRLSAAVAIQRALTGAIRNN
jgi:hypothetical protein